MHILQVSCGTKWTFKVCSWTTSKPMALIWTTTKSMTQSTFGSLSFGENRRDISSFSIWCPKREENNKENMFQNLQCSTYDIVIKLSRIYQTSNRSQSIHKREEHQRIWRGWYNPCHKRRGDSKTVTFN